MLIAVTQARADAGRVQLNAADLDDPAKVRAFNDAQNRLTQAIIPLQRLQEAYPDLKSNQNFLTLQSQIEGTENSILVARRDYNEAVQAITPASAPSPTRSAPRSSTAPSPRCRSKRPRARRTRPRSTSTPPAEMNPPPRRPVAGAASRWPRRPLRRPSPADRPGRRPGRIADARRRRSTSRRKSEALETADRPPVRRRHRQQPRGPDRSRIMATGSAAPGGSATSRRTTASSCWSRPTSARSGSRPAMARAFS